MTVLGRELKLVSWNVAGRKAKQPRQSEALLSRHPDLVALQEVTATTRPMWRTALEAADFVVVDSQNRAEDRKNFNLVAVRTACGSVVEVSEPWDGAYPERVLSVKIATKAHGQLELHDVHIVPGSSRGFAKVEQLRAVHAVLARECATHRIACGDFNTPQAESADGMIVTFADRHPRVFNEWDAAEKSILRGLEQHDLADMFRALHGYRVSAFSWHPHGRSAHVGRRFDHVFASKSLNGVRCEYLQTVREDALSDHAAIEAVFEPLPT